MDAQSVYVFVCATVSALADRANLRGTDVH